MKSITFISIAEIKRIQKGLIEQYGGAHGIRDLTLLESAIHMPMASVFGQYAYKNIYEMAAAYAYHIIKNHPFVDGNKRTGTFAALIFLKRNNQLLKIDKEKLFLLALQIATSKITVQEIAIILKTLNTTI